MSLAAKQISVIGAGLAGCECAYQLAESGFDVRLIEQKPTARTPAQVSSDFAELVCSNSLRGAAITNAVGLLKEEMRRTGSLIMQVADETRVPAGGALAVDRERFSATITARVRSHSRITVVCESVSRIPDERPCVIATGPLTGDALAADIAAAIGTKHLAYYDAVAPIVSADSLDWTKVFRASRYDKGDDAAYVNCPLDKDQYTAFVAAIREAKKVEPHAFEDIRYFEGCLPIEVMAERGERTLAFGPMKPVGLTDPKTGRWPYAVVQLRAEDPAQTAFNLVGFQTRMTWPEQKRVLGMIPGLENAEWLRMGTVHRNTFVNGPVALDDQLALLARPGVHLAGQVTGVEGYVESAACGLIVALLLAHGEVARPPRETALGSLLSHVRTPNVRFQPSNVIWSMFPPPANPKMKKLARYETQALRALAALDRWLPSIGRTAPARALDVSVPESVPHAAGL